MGLDMYLEARRFLWTNFNPEAGKTADDLVADAIRAAAPEIGQMRVKTIVCEAFYWRKANAIHRWFVNTVQEGDDDCKDYYVSREQLAELVNLCDRVLADRQLAGELLPAQSGFFFGSTEYDEWYFENLERTRDGLSELLAAPDMEKWDFHYHASW
jgi:hypothetical protein